MARRARRFRREKREYIWSTTLLTTETLTTTVQNVPLVVPAEWQRDGVSATAYQKGCVLLRIVGWFACIPLGTPTNPSTLAAMISKIDLEEVPPDPYVVTDYTDEDVFWTTGAIAGTVASIANSAHFEHVDIRSKRKLTSSDIIILTLQGDTTAPEWRYSLCLRALLQLP